MLNVTLCLTANLIVSTSQTQTQTQTQPPDPKHPPRHIESPEPKRSLQCTPADCVRFSEDNYEAGRMDNYENVDPFSLSFNGSENAPP